MVTGICINRYQDGKSVLLAIATKGKHRRAELVAYQMDPTFDF
jgi:hypothetical protein